jgi:membrane protein DedA with SNARE-associated domain
MLDLTNLSAAVQSLESGSYLILLLLMIIEGPIITYVAAFAAALGFFNIWWIFVLSIFGNQIPDMIYHQLGKMLRLKTIERFLSFFGFDEKKVMWIESHLKNHAIKTICTIKLVPLFPGVGLFLTGFMKVPFKKFFLTSLIYNLIASVIFCILGFYSGIAINEISKVLKLTGIIIPLLIVFIIIFYFAIKLIAKKLLKSKLVNFKGFR